MKSKVTVFIALAVFSASIAASEKVAVNLTGAFHAVTEKLINTGEEQSAFIYSVLGASKLADKKGNEWKFSIECLGFDEIGSSKTTSGVGRCSWTDVDKDKLYVSLHTEGESNRYKINGGTGKWAEASGEIVSHFEYLPAPSPEIFLGVDEGKGYLSFPELKK